MRIHQFHIGNHIASNGTCFEMMSAALANIETGRFVDGILLTTLSSHSSVIVWLYTKSITLLFWHMMSSFTTLKKNSRIERLLLGVPHLVLPPSVKVIPATSSHAVLPRPRTQPPRPRTCSFRRTNLCNFLRLSRLILLGPLPD